MKSDVLDLLVYLFEHFIGDEIEPLPDEDDLREELLRAGFKRGEIRIAFEWLGELGRRAIASDQPSVSSRSLRHYADTELDRLDIDCRGFLLFLEQNHIVNHVSRELVIERLMALDSEEITVDHVKWVVLMVLFSQPGEEDAFASMHGLVYDSELAGEFLH